LSCSECNDVLHQRTVINNGLNAFVKENVEQGYQFELVFLGYRNARCVTMCVIKLHCFSPVVIENHISTRGFATSENIALMITREINVYRTPTFDIYSQYNNFFYISTFLFICEIQSTRH